jgi:hypothetical protein
MSICKEWEIIIGSKSVPRTCPTCFLGQCCDKRVAATKLETAKKMVWDTYDTIPTPEFDHTHITTTSDTISFGPEVSDKIVSTGGSTSYYELPEHATELRHLISHKGMSKSRGDIFKACYRLEEKSGVDTLYDLNKMKFFIEDLIEMHERGEKL